MKRPAIKAIKAQRKAEILEMIAHGRTRREIVDAMSQKHSISIIRVDQLLGEIYKEQNSIYQTESSKRFIDDLVWMYNNRNTSSQTLALQYQKEINEVLGRHKKAIDVTSAGEKVTLIISPEFTPQIQKES